MANPSTSRYQSLTQGRCPKASAPETIEHHLDMILEMRRKRQAHPQAPPPDPKLSVIDQIRERMRDELIPAFEELKQKYAASGLLMEMDAGHFLSGGVQVVIEVAFESHGMRMEGTATPQGIAFYETRFSKDVRGVLTTGPLLRPRQLYREPFREFICERISHLVRSALTPGPSASL